MYKSCGSQAALSLFFDFFFFFFFVFLSLSFLDLPFFIFFHNTSSSCCYSSVVARWPISLTLRLMFCSKYSSAASITTAIAARKSSLLPFRETSAGPLSEPVCVLSLRMLEEVSSDNLRWIPSVLVILFLVLVVISASGNHSLVGHPELILLSASTSSSLLFASHRLLIVIATREERSYLLFLTYFVPCAER